MINAHAGEIPDYRRRIKGPRAAEAYKTRKRSKHLGEVRILGKGITLLPKGCSVLDVPCGNGRMTVQLARAGHRVTGVDLSDETLAFSRESLDAERLDADLVKSDIESLMFDDGAFDSAVCFRFFHHLPNDTVRRRVIDELCRVARHTILISYLSPWSPTMLKRRIRYKMGGKKSKQYATSLAAMSDLFAPHGFRLTANFAQMRWVHSLHLACFTKEAGAV